jgi:hypothetical protein
MPEKALPSLFNSFSQERFGSPRNKGLSLSREFLLVGPKWPFSYSVLPF